MNEKTSKFSIIILNWNGKEDTLNCLESVQKIDYSNYEIVVVDNGSTDDSVTAITERFPEVKIIQNEMNLGYAEGNNVGITNVLSCGADYVLLLNNDTVVDPQILKEFLQASIDYPEAGIFGAKIYYYKEPNKIWYAGVKWLPEDVAFVHAGDGQIDNGKDWEQISETLAASGCALLVKAEVVQAVGMLDPRYFLLWEETDWCYRVRRAGYKCLFVPHAKVWHKVSSTFESSFSGGVDTPNYYYFYLWCRNRLLWVERNCTLLEAFKLYRRKILKDIYHQLRGSISPKSTKQTRLMCRAGLQGTKDYIFRQFGNRTLNY